MGLGPLTAACAHSYCCNSLRITTKPFDEALNPSECHHLVTQTSVGLDAKTAKLL